MQNTNQSNGHCFQRIRIVLSPVAEKEKAFEDLCVHEKGDGDHNPQQAQDDVVLTAEELPTLTIAITHASGTSCRSSNGIRND